MEIVGLFTVSNTDFINFNKDVSDAINKLQDDKQIVEVQFNTNILSNNQLVYSALIIGRKNNWNKDVVYKEIGNAIV